MYLHHLKSSIWSSPGDSSSPQYGHEMESLPHTINEYSNQSSLVYNSEKFENEKFSRGRDQIGWSCKASCGMPPFQSLMRGRGFPPHYNSTTQKHQTILEWDQVKICADVFCAGEVENKHEQLPLMWHCSRGMGCIQKQWFGRGSFNSNGKPCLCMILPCPMQVCHHNILQRALTIKSK